MQDSHQRSEVDFAFFDTKRRAHSIGELCEFVALPELGVVVKVGDANRVPLPRDQAKTVKGLLPFY